MAHASVDADARIGTDCLLHPGVRVGERVVVGARVILHHNASLGADGFSFVSAEPAGYEIARGDTVDTPMRDIRRIGSIGTVVIGDDVTIGDDAVVGGSSGVGRDVPAGRIVMGTPAVSRSLWRTRLLAVGRAGRLLRELAALRRRTNVEK